MVFTEVVLEVGDTNFPLCRYTVENPGSWGVYRVVDLGLGSGTFHATVTFAGPPDAASALLKEMKESGRYDELEVLRLSPQALVLRVGHRTPESRSLVGIGLPPVAALLEAFGSDVVLEPFLVEGGRIRVRFLLAQPLETKRVILSLQDLAKSVKFDHFRVVRVSEFQARRYADVLRRVLAPEQEDLLRIALSLGYYSVPKRCTLEDIAKKVGLSVSPVHKKLKNIEQLLVSGHVDPALVASDGRPRRAARATPHVAAAPSPGGMFEYTLRVRWPGFEFASFAAQTPRARVVFQPLGEDARSKSTTALAVVLADPRDYRGLLERLAKRPDVVALDVVSRDTEHTTLKLRTTTPPEVAWGAHANPLPRLLSRLGREAFAKPSILEGEDVWLKIVFVQPPKPDELAQRLKVVADEAGFADYEIVAGRPVEFDMSISGMPPVDRMTARQEDVLKIAHALGYYKTPRECTLDDIARTLGISANAIHKNLTAAEQKIVFSYLSSGF